ncbi:MAG TPA: chemotaxis protein CheW [Gemmatimonadaceae bacterium]|nr:chemotaxis protein CheW [Gemmatimonadaceae bacterium]
MTRSSTTPTPDLRAGPADAGAAADAWEAEDAELPEADDEGLEPASPRLRTVRELLIAGVGQVDLLVFRLGRETFAIEIAAIEEAVELGELRPVPDAADALLGVADLRGRLLPVFTPARVLRADPSPDTPVMLVMREGERRVALAVDDVEDVLVLEPATLRTPSLRDAAEELVLGVVRAGDALITILDAAALLGATVSPLAEAA